MKDVEEEVADASLQSQLKREQNTMWKSKRLVDEAMA
jgi:hypothetical protein